MNRGCGNDLSLSVGVFRPQSFSSVRNTGKAVMVKAVAFDGVELASHMPTAPGLRSRRSAVDSPTIR